MSQGVLERSTDRIVVEPAAFAPRIAAVDPSTNRISRSGECPTDSRLDAAEEATLSTNMEHVRAGSSGIFESSDVDSTAHHDFGTQFSVDSANASLLTQLEWRIRRDAWACERDDLAEFTSAAAGDPTGDVLVVRAHVRKGTNPIITSTLADLRLYDRDDAYRGSSDDLVFLESLALVQHLVHVFRPADVVDIGGELMRNELNTSYDGAGVHGERFVWHAGEFMSVEVSPSRTSVYWSTDVSLTALAKELDARDIMRADALVDYQTVRGPTKPGVHHEATWAEFRELIASGRTHIGAASVDADGYRVWWGEASAARLERYPSMALTFASRDVEEAAADYVEATGTTDVRARGRQALKSVLGGL